MPIPVLLLMHKPVYMHRHTLILFVVFLSFSMSVSAQFTRGTRMVGSTIGSLLFNSGNSDQAVTSIGTATGKITEYNFSITPSTGWFISSNTAVGAQLQLNPSGNKISYTSNGATYQKDQTKNFNIGIGAFARNYFGAEGRFIPYGQLGFLSGISTYTKDGFFYGGSGTNAYKNSYETKATGGFFTDATLTAGLTRMMSDHLGLEIFIGYKFSYNNYTLNTTTLTDEGNDGTVDVTATNETRVKLTKHGALLGIGFQVFLPSRNK